MKVKIFFIAILSIVLLSCKQDKPIRTEKVSSKSLEADVKNSILTKDTTEITDTSGTISKNISSTAKNTKVSNKLIEKKRKLIQKKEKVIEEKMKSSKYKKMTCEEIINKYKEIIEEYKKTKNDELILWIDPNDPYYIYCHKKHITVFDSLDRVLDEIDEEEY